MNTMDSGQWELKNNFGTSGYLAIVGENNFCELFSETLIPKFLKRCHTKLNYMAIKKLCLYFKENCEGSEWWLDKFVMKRLKPEDQILYFI